MLPLPESLALVDDDPTFCEIHSQSLRACGVATTVFGSSNALLAHPQAYDFAFYLLDLTLPGIDGTFLIDVLRRRTQAGMVVVSGRTAPGTFQQVVEAGADMLLFKPALPAHVLAAVAAIHRRAAAQAPLAAPWRLDRRAGHLIAPDGAVVELSEIDRVVVECLLSAQGQPVTRDELARRLGRHREADSPDGLNAVVYRLRRRIQKMTPLPVPLQARPRVGYVFKAQLMVW